MSDDRAMRLAMIYRAIDQEERDFAEARTQHKDCLERLYNEAYKLREEILSGQTTLPLDTSGNAA